MLVAARYGGDNDEDSGSFEVTSTTNLPKSTQEVHLFHSKDDPVVAYESMAKFHADMPEAIIHSFDNRGHFIDETFPEMLTLLKQK